MVLHLTITWILLSCSIWSILTEVVFSLYSQVPAGVFAGSASAAPTTTPSELPKYTLAEDASDDNHHYFNIWDIPNDTLTDILNKECNNLNKSKLTLSSHLKVTKVLLLPLVPKGGSMEPPWENHFPTGILQWNLHSICMDNKKSQFWKKKI